jgi:hypothetical protein
LALLAGGGGLPNSHPPSLSLIESAEAGIMAALEMASAAHASAAFRPIVDLVASLIVHPS